MKKAVYVIDKTYEINGVLHPVRVSFRRKRGFVLRVSSKDKKTLLVSAPRYAMMCPSEVDWAISKHAARILENSKKNSACHFESELPKIYDGKTLLILGKKEEVGSRSPKDIEGFLMKVGLSYFIKRASEWARIMGVPYAPSIRVRTMSTRFGVNHLARHVITFTTLAICYAPEIVDYLIIHELAHCFVRGHQKDFYAIVKKYDPQYKIHSRKLKKGIYV